MASTPLNATAPAVSRRVVLGTLGAMLWPSRLAPGPAGRRSDDRRRRRGGEVLVALARAVRPGPRLERQLPGHLVGDAERPVEDAGSRPRQLVAHRVGRSRSSSRRPTTADGACRVLAFRRADGRQLWETFAPAGRTGSSHYKNGHASATPATDGERVYVSFGTRGLLAVDLNGKIVWQQDLGPMEAYHGTAGSPLLYRDRLILYQDQFSDSFIAAFDARTGRTLWRTNRSASVGWGTPIAVRVGDHDEIIVNSQNTVHGYDPDTGRELWRCRGSNDEVIPTPVVGHGMVFCSSGRAGPTLAIRPGGKGDVTRSHLAWTSPRGSPFVPSPILYGQ